MDWHPQAGRIDATRDGGSHDPTFPWRLVLHTTEGSTIQGAVAAYTKHGGWPHLTADPARTTLAQHIRFGRAARALQHPSGTPHTNRARAIQIEIVGFAGRVETWPSHWLHWLGATVIAPILASYPITDTHPVFTRADGVRRMSWAEWRHFDGVCGHQHVPANSHWDPGPLEVAAILAAARSTTPQEATVAFDLVDVAIAHSMPPDAKGRLPFWGVNAAGAVFAFNGAPYLGGLPDVDSAAHDDVVAIETHGNGYVIVRDDGHTDEGTWVASTYVFQA